MFVFVFVLEKMRNWLLKKGQLWNLQRAVVSTPKVCSFCLSFVSQ